MNIIVPSNLDPLVVVRRAGYGLVRDGSKQLSYARRLGGGFYPRFHIYLNQQEISLHLDQKQASYSGQKKHSGEYDGEVVSAEADRLINLIKSMSPVQSENHSPAGRISKSNGHFWNFWRK